MLFGSTLSIWYLFIMVLWCCIIGILCSSFGGVLNIVLYRFWRYLNTLVYCIVIVLLLEQRCCVVSGGSFMSSIILIVYIIGIIHFFMIRKDVFCGYEVYLQIMCSMLGFLLMLETWHLLIFFLGFEMVSLMTYIMIAMLNRRASAAEASLWYFILGTFSSCFVLFGIVWLFGVYGTFDIELLVLLLEQRIGMVSFFVHFMCDGAIYLLLIGFFVKLYIVPMHSVPLELYGTIGWVGFLFVGCITTCMYGIAFIRYLYIFAVPFVAQLNTVVQCSAIGTIIFGMLGGLFVSDIRRLMGYSTVATIGSFCLASICEFPFGQRVNICMLFVYIFACMCICITVLTFGQNVTTLEQLSGFFRIYSMRVFFILFKFASIAGLPIAIVFYYKIAQILTYWEVLNGIITSFLIFVTFFCSIYYFYIVRECYYETRIQLMYVLLPIHTIDILRYLWICMCFFSVFIDFFGMYVVSLGMFLCNGNLYFI